MDKINKHIDRDYYANLSYKEILRMFEDLYNFKMTMFNSKLIQSKLPKMPLSLTKRLNYEKQTKIVKLLHHEEIDNKLKLHAD